eukprot:NODE_892_length_1842_cov_44.869492_g790_i0.p1 GENE.NODE_892_length_1842_cov_44.869492_g790_i0~~NODE_892_length_1842_cov_44.869492_g790_i0.p1  ORF type:complete len:382 (+),score=48.93 NODE_892_length_1842_cov_44.869492_g790_i0:574-1719(+)
MVDRTSGSGCANQIPLCSQRRHKKNSQWQPKSPVKPMQVQKKPPRQPKQQRGERKLGQTGSPIRDSVAIGPAASSATFVPLPSGVSYTDATGSELPTESVRGAALDSQSYLIIQIFVSFSRFPSHPMLLKVSPAMLTEDVIQEALEKYRDKMPELSHGRLPKVMRADHFRLRIATANGSVRNEYQPLYAKWTIGTQLPEFPFFLCMVPLPPPPLLKELQASLMHTMAEEQEQQHRLLVQTEKGEGDEDRKTSRLKLLPGSASGGQRQSSVNKGGLDAHSRGSVSSATAVEDEDGWVPPPEGTLMWKYMRILPAEEEQPQRLMGLPEYDWWERRDTRRDLESICKFHFGDPKEEIKNRDRWQPSSCEMCHPSYLPVPFPYRP